MLVAKGEAYRTYRTRRHDAAASGSARAAMMMAKAALDQPGIAAGEDALAKREQVWRECDAREHRQGELPLREDS